MQKIMIAAAMAALALGWGGELSTRRTLNLSAVKAMVAGAEAEEKARKVHVTICILDESGNLLFLQRGDGAALNTLAYVQKKAKHALLYRSPSKNAQDRLKAGNLEVLIQPDAFPNQGGLPIKVDGETIGSIAASGAPSEVDEAIAQAGIDALMAWLKAK